MGGTLVGGWVSLCKELIRIIVLRQSCLVSLSEAILTKQDDHNKLDDRTTQRRHRWVLYVIIWMYNSLANKGGRLVSRGEVMPVEVKDALTLMVDFGMFIIGLLTLIVGIIALTQSKKK